MAIDLTTPIGTDVPRRASRAATRFTVDKHTIAVLRRLGRLMRAARPATRLRIPLVGSVAGRVGPRVQHPDAVIENKPETDDLYEFELQGGN